MAVTRWEPLKDLMALQEKMNRLFEETFSRGPQEEEIGVWSPPVDILERGDEVILKMEVPEVDQKDIDIKMEGNILTIKGERKLEEGTRREDYHRLERPYGKFSRSFSLPNTVDQGKVKATYKDGILRLILPKKEETKPKQIEVEVG
ncbi:MAG: Hsp20/alpha crystallin family protein [Deltaproteobacteria bacterium]|nr:MAG: Hsp20/alpha crystallin family protein [Deltaproteobacteria bacterium]